MPEDRTPVPHRSGVECLCGHSERDHAMSGTCMEPCTCEKFTADPGEWTESRLAELAAVLADVDAAVAMLPEAEQQKYRDARDSVIAARRYAERHAGEVWIG